MPIDYNQLAAAYAANRSVHPVVFARLHAAIGRDEPILEIGCGTGNYIGSLQAATKGAAYWGIDPSAEMLAVARSRWPDVGFRQAHGESLPFGGAQFGFVYSVDVVHHLTDPLACFQEARRALAGDGVFCTVTDSERIIETRRPLSTYWPETVAVEKARYPGLERLRAWLEQAGFTELREEVVEHHFALTNSAPYRARAFSALRLIDDASFARGLARLEADLVQHGQLPVVARYVLLWAS